MSHVFGSEGVVPLILHCTEIVGQQGFDVGIVKIWGFEDLKRHFEKRRRHVSADDDILCQS